MALDVQMLRDSFDALKPHAGDFVSHFYSTLFRNRPAAKGLFENVDMEKQKTALIQSLVFVVDHVDSPDKLTSFLKNLGSRHSKYGTLPEHFSWVGEALIETLKYFFGATWSQQLEETWTEAYGVIANTMIEGLKSAPRATLVTDNTAAYATTPSNGAGATRELKNAARGIAREILIKALHEEATNGFVPLAREKVNEILKATLEEEARKLLSDTDSDAAA